MNYSQKRTLIGRIVYIALTLMAVTILCVTMYTFFGGSREAATPPVLTDTPDTKLPQNTDKPSPKPSDTENKPSDAETNKPVDVTPSDPSDTEDAKPTDTPPAKDWTTLKVMMPLNGTVTKRHDLVNAVFSVTMNDYRVHYGVDLSGNMGDDVLACAYGTVTLIGKDPFMGYSITIDHGDGLVSRYYNLAEEPADGIREGATVYAGQAIGSIGESAIVEIAEEPHLHFELELNGKPIDPLTLLDYREPTPEPEQ
ncbi:MAG: M23 family metallopeptidase [Ruminococcaceae bacterium]|nr:M23 family metallopeptidase [Oscillospiraceae bacterium]